MNLADSREYLIDDVLDRNIYDSETMLDIIESMYLSCTDDDNIVYIKRYLKEILPLTEHISDERIKETLNKYKRKVTAYIEEEEKFYEKHADVPVINNSTFVFDPSEIYTYCGVIFENSIIIYHYLTDDETIKIGDEVIVSVGKNNVEHTAKVVSIGRYSEFAAPYPPDKAKFVKRKVE